MWRLCDARLTCCSVSEEDLQRRPSLRTWTIRYILTLLKHLHDGGRTDLLNSRPICTGLFDRLKDDPTDVVVELLSALQDYVLRDPELPKSAKASLLAQQNLERVTEIATRSSEGHDAADKAFAWLRAVCWNKSYGILRESGWYPAGTTSVGDVQQDTDIIDLGLDSIEFYDSENRPVVRNVILLSWLQTLRPHTNLQERELVLTCFAAAPELVAAYFAEKDLQFEAKLTNTWIGYASFLFEVVQLAMPESISKQGISDPLPPQTTIMIESILPRPLTQKILTRCFNQNSDMIKFFATRLLIIAMDKFATIRASLTKAAGTLGPMSKLWEEASERLERRFLERSPGMKTIIAAYRTTPDNDEHVLQREALARLLSLYYKTLPMQALAEDFDVSSSLGAVLASSKAEQRHGELDEIRSFELGHLLQIARYSSAVRWFAKPSTLELSPLLTLLELHRKDHQNGGIRDLLYQILIEHNIMSSHSACDALIASLIPLTDDRFNNIATHLDDYLARANRQPVKYLDDLENLLPKLSTDAHGQSAGSSSPFIAVLLEQSSFVVASESNRGDLVSWINELLQSLQHTEEEPEALKAVAETLAALSGWTALTLNTTSALALLDQVEIPVAGYIGTADSVTLADTNAIILFSAPPTESDDHPELFKWTKKDVDQALEDGDIDGLILCLCSEYPEIRIQARAQLQIFATKIRVSTLEDKDAIHLCIGEVTETYEHHCLPESKALPYLAGTFATHTLQVLMQPTHCMYPKINKYLNKGPEWRIQKLPSYWIENTILSQPEEDDSYWDEAQWVLNWLVDGLRSIADLEILRRAGVFEEIMSLSDSPGAEAHQEIQEKVLELLWRTTFVEGGSTTLVTRTGVLSWLDMMREGNDGLPSRIRERILETCDREKIVEWSGLAIESL